MSLRLPGARPTFVASSSLILAAVALALGAAYVWVVPIGLPYDEPSHWSTVLYYADHARMPVLGDPGVTYEAQMGPVAYVLDAVCVRAARAAGASLESALRLVRLLGIVELAITVPLVVALVRRLVSSRWAALSAAAVFAANPMLLTMSGSVQNDTLALLLGFLALELALVSLSNRPTIPWSILVGCVAGLAVLTKLTAWVVVVSIAGWLVWRHRRDALRPVAAFLAAALAVCGWWFVRNVVLYGDPTAATGVHRTGVAFGRYHVVGLAGVGHIAEELVTYLWLPTEYVRNLIGAPAIVKGALLAATIAALVGGLTQGGRRRRTHAPLVVVCGFLSLAWWLATYLSYWSFPPRVAYLALPLWLALVASALSRLPRRAGIALTAFVAVSINAWTIYELARVHAPTFLRT